MSQSTEHLDFQVVVSGGDVKDLVEQRKMMGETQILLVRKTRPFRSKIMKFEAPTDEPSIHEGLRFPCVANLYMICGLTSLDGNVCAHILKDKAHSLTDDLLLWDTWTNKYETLCKRHPHMERYISTQIALGLYKVSDDDYKLLLVSRDDDGLSVHIMSLKSKKWRKLDSENYQTLSTLGLGKALYPPEIRSSTWFNGHLYFSYQNRKNKIECSVIKFDTENEKFSVIQTDSSLRNLDIKRLSLRVQKGDIYLGVEHETEGETESKEAYIELWRMIGDENWERVGAPYIVDIYMLPLHWITNKTWLMIKEGDYLYKVDHSENVKGTRISGIYGMREYIECFIKEKPLQEQQQQVDHGTQATKTLIEQS